jgi:hypothetical protein
VFTGVTGWAVCSTSTTDKLHERVSEPYAKVSTRADLDDKQQAQVPTPRYTDGSN